MVSTMVLARPIRSLNIPKYTPPTAPPIRKAPSAILPMASRSSGVVDSDNREPIISFMLVTKICPSKMSKTHPSEAMVRTSHW